MERILEGFNQQSDLAMRNYFEFAFTSGMRTSELIALRWRDVDFDRAWFTCARRA